MLLWTILKVALGSLLANKLRSFLAMLGIIIGVAAVISMLALGAGTRREMIERVSARGTHLLVIRSRWWKSRGVRLEVRQNLTLADAQALVDEVSAIHQVAPLVRRNAQIKYFNRNTRSNVVGTTVTYLPIRDYEVERGRPFTEGETEQGSRVTVLGPTTVEELFDGEEPLGKTVKIKGINFEVVGVLKAKGEQGWSHPDEVAIVPYTVAMKQLFGLKRLHEIDVQAITAERLNEAKEEATAILRRRHRLRPENENDFWIRNQAELLERIASMSQTFTIFLGSIAGISLLVGGIGIMNIMLVTVTERTREIGIRKAIGAKNRDILRQFLLEAMLLSGLGGGAGVALGVGAARLVNRIPNFSTAVEPASVLLAFSFAAAVGVFFGYYPARRAARLDPIDALRYE